MAIPKQYVAMEVIHGFDGNIAGLRAITEDTRIIELDGGRYGQVLPSTGELVQTFTATELLVLPVISNG